MRWVVVLLLSSLASTEASSETNLPIKEGAWVRVSSPYLRNYPASSLDRRGPSKIVGTVTSLGSDTLIVRAQGRYGAVLSIPTAAISRLEVRNGSRRRVAEGAGAGFLIGAGLGAILGASQDESQSFFTDGQAAFLMGAFMGGAGLVAGAIVGATKRGEKWERLRLGKMQVILVPSKRPHLAAAVRF